MCRTSGLATGTAAGYGRMQMMAMRETLNDHSRAAGRLAHQAWNPAWLQRQPRWARIACRSAAITLLAVFLLWLVLFVTKGRFLKTPFESIASASAERSVLVGGDFQLYFAPFQIKFLAEDLTIANPDWAQESPFLTAKTVDARIAPFSLIFGLTRFRHLALEGADLDLRWDRGHRRNSWTFGSRKAEPLELPLVDHARISGTRIVYRDPQLALAADIRVETVKAEDLAFAQAIRFAGTGSMRRNPFMLEGRLLSPDQTIAGGENRLELSATAGSTWLAVQGRLKGATQLDGGRFALRASGTNLARLFDFLGVAVPESRHYSLSSDLLYQDEQWRFTGLEGVIGESDITGGMTVSMPKDRLLITGALASKSADMLDIGPVVGYDPERLDAQGGAGAVRQVNGTPRLLPDAPLRMAAVQRFDAHLDFTIGTIRNEHVPVSDVALTFDLDHGRMTLSPMSFNLAGGKLAADIVIDAREQPVRTNYDIRLSPTPMGRLLTGFGIAESGTSGTLKGRIKLTGIGDNVRESLATSRGRIAIVIPRGSLSTRNVQLSELDIGVFAQKMFESKLEKPVQINCGLIGFTVRDGVAAADPILIDTSKNVILGRGGFSFKTEALDMAVRADGKKISLFSGQSPVAVNGFFGAPSIDPISADLMGRAGAGLGLSLLASPLAGILAFVDVGDAKPVDCGPVLAGARAAAQRTIKGERRDDVGNGSTGKSEDGRASPAEMKAQRDRFLKGKASN